MRTSESKAWESRSSEYGLALGATARFAAVVVLAGLLAGCADGVELNGKVFDLLGVSSQAAKREAKLAERAPLVVPPSNKLPPPGAARTAPPDPAWPVDADAQRIASEQAQKEKVRKMCADAAWQKKTNREEFDRITKDGTLCASFLHNLLKKAVQ